MLKVICLSLLIAILSVAAVGCRTVSTTERGEVTPVLAAIKVISEYLQMPVTLQLETFNTHQDWVYLSGLPLTLEGRPIDYRFTPLAEDFAEGFIDDNFVALVRYAADGSAGWQVVELSIGTTDAPFVDWLERYGLPAELALSR